MTVALGVMGVPAPALADDLHNYQTGALRDGGLWTALRRLSDHDHSGGEMGAPVAGGGGGGAEVTISGTEGVTVVEAPANTFALGLTASPDASNTVEIRANGIYSAAGAIPPEYVTDAELATALGPYATDADLANHAAAADPHPTYTTAAELSTAISAHAGAADPHPTYSTAAEVTSAITAHEGLANPHPTYATDADLTAHAGAADPHPTYTTAAEVTTAITAHEGLANPHPTYTTDAEVATAISTHAGAADPHPTYLTAAEGNALYRPISYVTDVTVTTNASLTATESPANTFALAAQLSPDANNALALRANGLYATIPGSSGLPTTGGTMSGSILVQTTNTIDLGATAARWRKLWATDVESTNTPTVGGTALPTFTTADARYLQSATASATYVPLAGGSVLTGLLGPTTTNTRDLGTTALRWRKLWAVDGEFTNVPTVGGVSLDSRYALASALTALTTRVATLEGQVATLQAQMTGHTHQSGTIDNMGGTAVMP